MKKFVILPFFCLCSVLSGCKKSTPDNSCKISMESISGDYRMISNVSKGSNGDIIDTYANADPCLKDNMWTFAPNGYLYVKDIGIRCDPAAENIETWSIVGNELHVTGGSVTIKSFDCDKFSYEGTDEYNGVNYTTTVTFRRY